MGKLGWCMMCKEKSMYVKITGVKRVSICSNEGCGYTEQLPDLCPKRPLGVNGALLEKDASGLK